MRAPHRTGERDDLRGRCPYNRDGLPMCRGIQQPLPETLAATYPPFEHIYKLDTVACGTVQDKIRRLA